MMYFAENKEFNEVVLSEASLSLLLLWMLQILKIDKWPNFMLRPEPKPSSRPL